MRHYAWAFRENFPGPYQNTFGDFELSNTNPFEQSELIRLAIAGLDTEIAALQEKRAQLAAMIGSSSAVVEVSTANTATPTSKGGKMSDEAKAKISAAAKKRWAKVKKAKADAAKLATAAKIVPAKKTSVKAQSAPTKGKKAPAKKGKATPATPASEAASE